MLNNQPVAIKFVRDIARSYEHMRTNIDLLVNRNPASPRPRSSETNVAPTRSLRARLGYRRYTISDKRASTTCLCSTCSAQVSRTSSICAIDGSHSRPSAWLPNRWYAPFLSSVPSNTPDSLMSPDHPRTDYPREELDLS